MTKFIRYIRKAKLNKNKKGFTLVELLVAIAIIAILTPVVVQGFIYASKLNYRSRLQQRADAAANSIYEGIASVKYEDLENYLSGLNGWEPVTDESDEPIITDESGEEYEYYVKKYYDELKDCEIKVAVQEYSESYVVPDLNFVGVGSKYLSLAREINSLDSVAKSKIEQAIKSDNEIKNAIAKDITEKFEEIGLEVDIAEISKSRIFVDCGTIDSDAISKQTKINLIVEKIKDKKSMIHADYEVSYRYPASTPNPNDEKYPASTPDSSNYVGFPVKYSYSHFINGEWREVNNEIDLCEHLSGSDSKYQFVMKAESGRKTIDAVLDENDKITNNGIFVYYDPFSRMDWLDITCDKTGADDIDYNVFLIDQSEEGNSLVLSNTDASLNNFKFSSISKESNDYTLLINETDIKLYSNNKTISANGIPDYIYESKENKTKMYRIQVYVTYKSTIFANVSGSFTIDKNSK